MKTALLIKKICPAVVVMLAVIASQPIKTIGDTSTFTAHNYQKKVSLGQRNVAIGGAGYVTGIYLHPKQRDLAYIKTDVGGFYRWNSQQQTWVPLTEHFLLTESNYYGGEGLALDPNDANIVYIAAGKYVWSSPGTIFKSKDKGATWTKLNLDLPMGGNQDKRWVGERLVVSPFDSKVIFFGSRRDGLWKSTDAGNSWTKVSSFPGKPKADIGILAIVFNKHSPGKIYVNAYGDGIYESSDTGVSWRKIPASPKTAMRLAVASDGTLYATSESSPGVSKYVNETWTDITPETSSQAIFNGLSVNPDNPNHVIVSLGETEKTKIYQSLNGGSTWKELKDFINNKVPWQTNYYFANNVAAIEFDPHVAGRVWFTDWFGVWRTENITNYVVFWKNYPQGHEEVVPFTLVSPPTGPLLLSGVADVNGFYHDQGLDSYPSKSLDILFQDTFSIAYLESNPLHMIRIGGNRWNSTFTGATSTNGGKTWKELPSFPAKNVLPMRVAMSATDANVFIVTFSKNQPWFTTDGGNSWTKVAGLPNGDQGPWNWSQPLAADKVDGNTFYYYAKGKFYQSINGGKSFQVVNSSLPSEDWHMIKTVPGAKGEVCLSLDWQGLYCSKDGGKTFAKIGNVNRAYLFSFGKPPENSTIPALYLYGKISDKGNGIYRSLDQGKTWTRIGNPETPVGNETNVMEASKQKFGLVFLGTNGRGIYYGSE